MELFLTEAKGRQEEEEKELNMTFSVSMLVEKHHCEGQIWRKIGKEGKDRFIQNLKEQGQTH